VDEVYPGVYLVEEGDVGGGWRELTWFVDTPEGGVLVDPQTFGPATAKAVDRLGGASFVFVTHALGVGDVCPFKERYHARLVAHRRTAAAIGRCAVDQPFDHDTPLFQGVRAVVSGVHSPGSSMLYVMRDRGFLFAGDFLAVAGARGPASLQVREGGDPEAKRQVLAHLRALRFGAVLPYRTRHESASSVGGTSEAIVDGLQRVGVYAPH
jgi:glyoxylase-like metal-dependent hydrolase (beta-lactamase superfamily II)